MISCRERALKIISIKDRTEKELRDKLNEKGYQENDIDVVIEFLKEYKYIDDTSFAINYAKDCVCLKKWGKTRIKTELVRKGIDKELAQEAVENACEDSGSLVLSEMKKRFKDADFSNPKERMRIFGYFARRGFSPNEIKGAINQLCSFEDIECDYE